MFKQFYERAKEANSAYSLATWIYKGLEFAFPRLSSLLWPPHRMKIPTGQVPDNPRR
jgi:hypothetical protein